MDGDMRILDTFCKAGGATKGYQMAGFDVVGVDIEPQPHYCGDAFIQADALDVLYALAHGDCWPDQNGRDWHLEDFDVIHASPPCQFYSRLRHLPWLRDRVYWRSIPPTREALRATGMPYVIENVEDAKWDMETPAIICGQALGLRLIRHRCFETWPYSIFQPSHQKHGIIVSGRASLGKRHHGQQGFKEISRDSIAGKGNRKGDAAMRRMVTGIDWMNTEEMAQAVPPVYTEFIGNQFVQYMRG